VLIHLAAVALAAIVTAGVLGGAGELIIVGRASGAPRASPTIDAPIATAAPASTISASPTATIAAATPTSSPAPTPAPLSLAPFRYQGHAYLGITTAEPQWVFAAPFAGTVEIRVYQLIDGEVRVGSSVPGLPFFPYVAVVSPDRKIVYRPGALGPVTDLIVTDGATVSAGDPLFRLVGAGRSSWATFYDGQSQYQVVVSLQSVPGAKDLDPAQYFAGG
jgi:hypothetical protein